MKLNKKDIIIYKQLIDNYLKINREIINVRDLIKFMENNSSYDYTFRNSKSFLFNYMEEKNYNFKYIKLLEPIWELDLDKDRLLKINQLKENLKQNKIKKYNNRYDIKQ